MASYQYRGLAIGETVQAIVNSMLTVGRIMHSLDMPQVTIMNAVMSTIENRKEEIKNKNAHYACLAIFNNPKFEKMASEYKDVESSISDWRKLVFSLEDSHRKFYYSYHVTLDDYKQHGRDALLISKYYSKQCFSNEQFLEDLISVDRPLSLPISNSILQKVIERMKFLIKNHEEYWIYMTQNLYSLYIKRVYALSNLNEFDLSLIKELLEFEFDANISKMISNGMLHGSDHKKIPIHKLAYSLGVPSGIVNCCYFAPSISSVFSMYEKVKENPESHLEQLLDRNKKNQDMLVEVTKMTYGKCEICNTHNLIGEDILNYHDFDIVRCSDDQGHIYSFTRDEIPELIKRGSNPYNEIKFDIPFMQVMKNRSSVTDLVGDCKPINELWNEIGILESLKKEDVYVDPKYYSLERYIEKRELNIHKMIVRYQMPGYSVSGFMSGVSSEQNFLHFIQRIVGNDIMFLRNDMMNSRQESEVFTPAPNDSQTHGLIEDTYDPPEDDEPVSMNMQEID